MSARMTATVLAVMLLVLEVNAKYGSIPGFRCSLQERNLDQMTLQRKLIQRSPCSEDGGDIGIIGQHLAVNHIPFLISGTLKK